VGVVDHDFVENRFAWQVRNNPALSSLASSGIVHVQTAWPSTDLGAAGRAHAALQANGQIDAAAATAASGIFLTIPRRHLAPHCRRMYQGGETPWAAPTRPTTRFRPMAARARRRNASGMMRLGDGRCRGRCLTRSPRNSGRAADGRHGRHFRPAPAKRKSTLPSALEACSAGSGCPAPSRREWNTDSPGDEAVLQRPPDALAKAGRRLLRFAIETRKKRLWVMARHALIERQDA